MSHSHSHAPGENHSHSHGPPQGGPPPQQQQQQQFQQLPPTDPVLQAIIEADFRAVDIKLGPPENASATCGAHGQEKCGECDVDYVCLNRLSRLLVANPNLRCPPPAQVVSQQLTQAITNTKEEGNALFKMAKHQQAIARYTMAASIAVQRPPWEANQLMREELSTVLSNRSASYCECQDYIPALVDADAVIQLRRNWSKGHFRKAKALLGLERWEEAREAIGLGLSFEPSNMELNGFIADINKAEQKAKAAKALPAPSEKVEPASVAVAAAA